MQNYREKYRELNYGLSVFFSSKEEDFRECHSRKVEMEKNRDFEVVVYLCVIIHFIEKKWEKS